MKVPKLDAGSAPHAAETAAAAALPTALIEEQFECVVRAAEALVPNADM